VTRRLSKLAGGIIFVFAFLGFDGNAPAQAASPGPTIPDYTLSPNHKYGVTVPSEDGDETQNRLVEVQTKKTIAVIQGDTQFSHMAWDDGTPPRWSIDSSLLLWRVEDKWNAATVTALKLDGNKVAWQIDIFRVAQQAILTRTRQAKPHEYDAIKKDHSGWGSAYPDGFAVDVYAGGIGDGPISLPLTVHADLTSDTKGMNLPRDMSSQLDGVVDKDGKFTITKFRVGLPTIPPRKW
jgi:hypothetical protein